MKIHFVKFLMILNLTEILEMIDNDFNNDIRRLSWGIQTSYDILTNCYKHAALSISITIIKFMNWRVIVLPNITAELMPNKVTVKRLVLFSIDLLQKDWDIHAVKNLSIGSRTEVICCGLNRSKQMCTFLQKMIRKICKIHLNKYFIHYPKGRLQISLNHKSSRFDIKKW